MSERKRGYQLGNYFARKEGKLLGGYPVWDAWKHTLQKHLESKGFGNLNSNVEPFLHEFYVLRRRQQIRNDVTEEMDAFNELLNTEHEELFDNEAIVEAFRFIGDKTTRPPKYRIRST